MQKLAEDLSADYLHYELFDNDPAGDKIIREAGKPDRTRGQFVADLLVRRLGSRGSTRVLEIGCHRGAFLSALREVGPDFDLHGFDLDPEYRKWVEPICGPGHYHTESLDNLPGLYDGCVLIHTLEHIPDPLGTLQKIRRLMVPDGVLIVVVPDVLASPVDLLVIDHTCHFFADQLRLTLARAGYMSFVDSAQIANELVAIARPSANGVVDQAAPPVLPPGGFPALVRFERALGRLPAGNCHVFGTAHVGALVAGMLGERCSGFVDESPFRIGKTFLGRSIRPPQAVVGEVVILGVADRVAARVAPRLAAMGVRVINPWEASQEQD